MNKKKIAAMTASLALVAVIGIGATLAYFTDKTDTKTNVVTMGKVDIDLIEETTSDNGDKEGNPITGGLDFPDVMPGDTLSKIPSVTVNEDSQNAYIRVSIKSTPDHKLLAAGIGEATVLSWLDIDDTLWVKGTDNYYYYQRIASAGAKLTIFNTVSIPNTLNNNAANGSFSIVIDAEAIQVDNVTPIMTGTQITGWPEAEILKLEN